MKCPECQNEKTRVIYTDSHDTVIRRARKCDRCGWVFNTCEELLEATNEVLKLQDFRRRIKN